MSRRNSKLKQPRAGGGERIKTPAQPSESRPDDEPPVFCLRYMHSDYSVRTCSKEDRAAFADTLYELSQLSWSQLRQSQRHGKGYEKIPRGQLRVPPSSSLTITEDVDFISFRFAGKKPMIGFRDRDGRTFRIVYLDPSFEVYEHG